MTSATRATLASSREAFHSLRTHAEKVAERGLVKTSAAAEAAEKASRRAARAISRGSQEISSAVQNYVPARRSGLAALPVISGATRLARRHPGLLITAGLATALVGYAAWQRRSEAKEHTVVEDMD